MAMRVGVIDGFDHYPNIGTSNGGVGTVWIPAGFYEHSLTTGLNGVGKAIRMTGLSGTLTRYFKGGPTAKCSWLTSFKVIQHYANTRSFSLVDEFGNDQFGFGYHSTGKIGLYGENNTLLKLSTQDIGFGITYRLCIQVDSTGGANTLTVSINGLVDVGLSSADGLDIIDSGVSTLFGGIRLQTGALDFDDIFVGCDELVEYGPKEILTSQPTADAIVEFASSGVNPNWMNVAEVDSNLDVDYNISSTIGQRDIFDFADLTRIPDEIIAVAVISHARKEASGTRKMRNLLKSGGVEYFGDEFALSESYVWNTDAWITNPNGGIPWTLAARDAAQAGYKLTSLDV